MSTTLKGGSGLDWTLPGWGIGLGPVGPHSGGFAPTPQPSGWANADTVGNIIGAGASVIGAIIGSKRRQAAAPTSDLGAYLPMIMIGGMVTVLVVALVAGGKK